MEISYCSVTLLARTRQGTKQFHSVPIYSPDTKLYLLGITLSSPHLMITPVVILLDGAHEKCPNVQQMAWTPITVYGTLEWYDDDERPGFTLGMYPMNRPRRRASLYREVSIILGSSIVCCVVLDWLLVLVFYAHFAPLLPPYSIHNARLQQQHYIHAYKYHHHHRRRRHIATSATKVLTVTVVYHNDRIHSHPAAPRSCSLWV